MDTQPILKLLILEKLFPIYKFLASLLLDFHLNATCGHLHGHLLSLKIHCSTMSLECVFYCEEIAEKNKVKYERI